MVIDCYCSTKIYRQTSEVKVDSWVSLKSVGIKDSQSLFSVFVSRANIPCRTGRSRWWSSHCALSTWRRNIPEPSSCFLATWQLILGHDRQARLRLYRAGQPGGSGAQWPRLQGSAWAWSLRLGLAPLPGPAQPRHRDHPGIWAASFIKHSIWHLLTLLSSILWGQIHNYNIKYLICLV